MFIMTGSLRRHDKKTTSKKSEKMSVESAKQGSKTTWSTNGDDLLSSSVDDCTRPSTWLRDLGARENGSIEPDH